MGESRRPVSRDEILQLFRGAGIHLTPEQLQRMTGMYERLLEVMERLRSAKRSPHAEVLPVYRPGTDDVNE